MRGKNEEPNTGEKHADSRGASFLFNRKPDSETGGWLMQSTPSLRDAPSTEGVGSTFTPSFAALTDPL